MTNAVPENGRDQERNPRAPQHSPENYKDRQQWNERTSHGPTKLRSELFHSVSPFGSQPHHLCDEAEKRSQIQTEVNSKMNGEVRG